jgi:hypothetical protein
MEIGYFIKYLDQININSAFVSGMQVAYLGKHSFNGVANFKYRKEDLGLYKNELNYMQTCWTVGYVLGEIPSNIILTKFRPSIWMPTMEVSDLPYHPTHLIIS